MINITINNDIAVEWESVSFFAWLTWEKDHVTIQGELYQLPVRKRQNIVDVRGILQIVELL